MNKSFVQTLVYAVLATFVAWTLPAQADPMSGMMMAPPPQEFTQLAGPYRLKLVMLPAEPYFTKAQVQQQHIRQGMLVIGGAKPIQRNDVSRPNHHLVVHVYSRASGKALPGSRVSMTYAPIGNPMRSVSVSIVEMQAIGGGPESTHYGNNVTLKPGTYRVNVTVNGQASASFTVRAS